MLSKNMHGESQKVQVHPVPELDFLECMMVEMSLNKELV